MRWAIVMPRVFAMTKAPTKSATKPNARRKYSRIVRKLFVSFAACFASCWPVRTWAVAGKTGVTCETSCAGVTFAFDAMPIESSLPMQAGPDSTLRQVADRDPVRVQPAADLADITVLMTDYNLLNLPVVDDDDHVIGVITVDDVLNHRSRAIGDAANPHLSPTRPTMTGPSTGPRTRRVQLTRQHPLTSNPRRATGLCLLFRSNHRADVHLDRRREAGMANTGLDPDGRDRPPEIRGDDRPSVQVAMAASLLRCGRAAVRVADITAVPLAMVELIADELPNAETTMNTHTPTSTATGQR